jgi:glycosyltransferase involved in cell wall biosynthesis
VIENGVDFNYFNRANHPRDYHQIYGLTVGRITPQKGIDILLQALALLPEDILWRWQFVGDTPDPKFQEIVRRLARDLNIEDRIDWVGIVKRSEIVNYYEQANLYALPSRWEGQANVILEAMSAGLSIITSQTDGISDLIRQHPDCLTMVDSNVPEDWAKTIASSWQNPQRSRSINAGIEIARSRTWDQVGHRHLQAYHLLLNSLFESKERSDV